MDNTRDVAQYRQKDVDEEVGIATSLKEHAKRWKDDGEDDLADVAILQLRQRCSPCAFWCKWQCARLRHCCD